MALHLTTSESDFLGLSTKNWMKDVFKHLQANTTIIVVHFKNVPRSNSNTKNHWDNSKQLSACETSTPTLTSYLVVPIFLTTVNGISPSVTSLLRSKFKTNFKNFVRLENSTVNLNQDAESTSIC